MTTKISSISDLYTIYNTASDISNKSWPPRKTLLSEKVKHEYLRFRAYKCLSLSSSVFPVTIRFSNYFILWVIYQDTRAYILDLAPRNFSSDVSSLEIV